MGFAALEDALTAGQAVRQVGANPPVATEHHRQLSAVLPMDIVEKTLQRKYDISSLADCYVVDLSCVLYKVNLPRVPDPERTSRELFEEEFLSKLVGWMFAGVHSVEPLESALKRAAVVNKRPVTVVICADKSIMYSANEYIPKKRHVSRKLREAGPEEGVRAFANRHVVTRGYGDEFFLTPDGRLMKDECSMEDAPDDLFHKEEEHALDVPLALRTPRFVAAIMEWCAHALVDPQHEGKVLDFVDIVFDGNTADGPVIRKAGTYRWSPLNATLDCVAPAHVDAMGSNLIWEADLSIVWWINHILFHSIATDIRVVTRDNDVLPTTLLHAPHWLQHDENKDVSEGPRVMIPLEYRASTYYTNVLDWARHLPVTVESFVSACIATGVDMHDKSSLFPRLSTREIFAAFCVPVEDNKEAEDEDEDEEDHSPPDWKRRKTAADSYASAAERTEEAEKAHVYKARCEEVVKTVWHEMYMEKLIKKALFPQSRKWDLYTLSEEVRSKVVTNAQLGPKCKTIPSADTLRNGIETLCYTMHYWKTLQPPEPADPAPMAAPCPDPQV